MTSIHKWEGPDASPTKPITTEAGDPKFDALMGQRRFEDRAVKPLGRIARRPDSLGVPGTGSSITYEGGSRGGRVGWSAANRGAR